MIAVPILQLGLIELVGDAQGARAVRHRRVVGAVRRVLIEEELAPSAGFADFDHPVDGVAAREESVRGRKVRVVRPWFFMAGWVIALLNSGDSSKAVAGRQKVVCLGHGARCAGAGRHRSWPGRYPNGFAFMKS